jgi:hypothetical protein
MSVQDQIKVNGILYRLQPRKCGKPGCKCNIPGQEHGPYWYSYDGISAAKYVGSKLPDHVLKHIELRLHMFCARIVIVELSPKIIEETPPAKKESQYIHEPAYAKGIYDFADGVRRGSNPYSASGSQRACYAWWDGWDAAWEEANAKA